MGRSDYDVIDGLQMPAGYFLRRAKTFQNQLRPFYAILLCRDDERVVGGVDINRDEQMGRMLYTIVFQAANGLPRERMHDHDMQALIIRACARDRVTG